ncbi:MAG TPA: hypothetical protein VIJ92_00915 [Ginsengibacter sp.]
MIKLSFLILLISTFSCVHAQQDFFQFKKKDKTIATFKKYSYIAFGLKDHQWYTGYVQEVKGDTFYVNPFILHITMFGIDTVHLSMMEIPLKDVYAMPKRGVQFGYYNEKAVITHAGGHVHWVWIKNGLLFQTAGTAYIVLNVVNGIINNNFSFSGSKFGIAAAVLLVGELLHYTYKSYLRLGKKYYLQSIKITSS